MILPDDIWFIVSTYLTIDEKIKFKIKPNKLNIPKLDLYLPSCKEDTIDNDKYIETSFSMSYSLVKVVIYRKQYRKRHSKKLNGKIGFEHFIELKNPLTIYYSNFFGYYSKIVHVFRISDWNRKVLVLD